MRQVIKYDLNYREGEESETLYLEIDFVPNSVIRGYNEIIQVVYDTQKLWGEILECVSKQKKLMEEKPDNFREQSKVIESEITDKSESIKRYGASGIFERRFELICKVLRKNGVKNEKFFAFEFWDDCVDVNDMYGLLEACALKDSSKKKV